MSQSAISPKKIRDLQATMARLGIREEDIIETFIKGGGKGGQKVNSASTKVQLSYPKYNLSIATQVTRSRECNRFFARRQLCERVSAHLGEGLLSIDPKQAKRRKQKKRRRRRAIRH